MTSNPPFPALMHRSFKWRALRTCRTLPLHLTPWYPPPPPPQIFQVEGTADMSDIARRVFSAPQFWLAGVLLAPVMSLVRGLEHGRAAALTCPIQVVGTLAVTRNPGTKSSLMTAEETNRASCSPPPPRCQI